MPEFTASPTRLVNTVTAGNQVDPHVAALAGGGFVVVWTDLLLSTSAPPQVDIHAQLYDASGAKAEGELLLVPDASADAVTALANGGFAVAATSSGAGVATVVSLRFDAAGAQVGSPEVVLVAGEPTYPMLAWGDDIDALANGGYAVTASTGNPRPPPFETLFVRDYDASGAPATAALPFANPFGLGFSNVNTSALPEGGWVTTWSEVRSPYAPEPYRQVHTFFELFDSAGAPGGVVTVDPNPALDESSPSVAALANGCFVLSWWVPDAGPAASHAQLQLFDGEGAPASPVIDYTTAVPVSNAQLTALADGGFLLAFEQAGTASSDGLWAQYFDAAGRAVGTPFALGTAVAPSYDDRGWSISATADGGFVLATEQGDAATGEDVYVREFAPKLLLEGGNGKDVLMGGAAGESFHGGNGKDTITGGGGNDFIDGGRGVDTAVYAGPRSDYTITQTADGFTVADRTGADGIDTLVNVERLQFADESVQIVGSAHDAG